MTSEQAIALALTFKDMDEFDIAHVLVRLEHDAKVEGMEAITKLHTAIGEMQ